MRRFLQLLFMAVLFLGLFTSHAALFAQENTSPPAPEDMGAHILWPPPVSEVWGTGEVIGTAAIPDMAYYYLEYIELTTELTIPQNAPWIPATTAITVPVSNGPLVTLDTSIAPDGVYALRLVVLNNSGEVFTDIVQPVRLNNTRMQAYTDRVIAETLAAYGIELEPDPTSQPGPVIDPVVPTAIPASGVGAVNVRYCDVIDNNGCPVIGWLDTQAAIIARSANDNGWLQVQLPSGLAGWVSPTVIQVGSDISMLPAVTPPMPLPPPAVANIALNGISTQGKTDCGVTFNVQVNVVNNGDAASNEGTVTLQDVNLGTGEVTATVYGAYPALNPGANFVVNFPVTTTVYYNETHELRAYAGNQDIRIQYVLGQGNCNIQPTQPPPPPPPQEIIFDDDQCFVALTQPWPAFSAPYGELITQLAARAWEIRSLQMVNGEAWYSLELPEMGQLWISRVEDFTQGNCGRTR